MRNKAENKIKINGKNTKYAALLLSNMLQLYVKYWISNFFKCNLQMSVCIYSLVIIA